MKKHLALLALGACLVQFASAAPVRADDDDWKDYRHHRHEAREQMRKANRAAFYGNYWKAREHERKAYRQQRKALHNYYDIDD